MAGALLLFASGQAGLADSPRWAYMSANSGALVSTPTLHRERATGRAPVFLCLENHERSDRKSRH